MLAKQCNLRFTPLQCCCSDFGWTLSTVRRTNVLYRNTSGKLKRTSLIFRTGSLLKSRIVPIVPWKGMYSAQEETVDLEAQTLYFSLSLVLWCALTEIRLLKLRINLCHPNTVQYNQSPHSRYCQLQGQTTWCSASTLRRLNDRPMPGIWVEVEIGITFPFSFYFLACCLLERGSWRPLCSQFL